MYIYTPGYGYNNYESIVLSTHFSACLLLTYSNDCFVKLDEKLTSLKANKKIKQ